MSVNLNTVGYAPTTQAAQAAQTTPKVQRVAVTQPETTEAAAKSEKAQVDTYESGAKNDAYEVDAESVQRMKADLEQQKTRFLTTVKDMLTKQGVKVAEGDGIWKQFANGEIKADAETQAAAKEATSENGYWGAKQTSERFLKYAKALTGGDPAKAEEMREAFKKGYKEAEKAWGGSLPDLAQKTYDETMKLFDDWAKEATK